MTVNFPSLNESLVILDVGHGNSAVLIDGDSVIVFDTGTGSALLELLREQGITRIDTVLLSHSDHDHIAGLNALLSNSISIGKVRANTDSIKGSSSWDDLMFELSDNPEIDFQTNLTTDNTGEFDTEQVAVEIVAPTSYLAAKGPGSSDRENRRLGTNSLSAVVRLTFGGKPFALLPGDLDAVGLANLPENNEISADLLVFPHHGGRQGGADVLEYTQGLMDAVQPTHVIFSIGRGKHGTPRPEIVDAIRSHSPKCRISCSQLSEHCATEIPTEVDSTHLGNIFSIGKRKKVCCAGSVVYNFRSENFTPDLQAHREFISRITESPLCGIRGY
jgi:competence protein ComEC